jgi:hypothetical protein
MMHDYSSSNPLILEGLQPFATGGGRDCYIYPDNQNLCIKVARKGRSPEERRLRVPWWKRWRKPAYKYDDNLRDFSALNALEHDSPPETWQHLPRCYGWVDTDRGMGLVTDLVRDADGQISRTLRQHIQTSTQASLIQSAVDDFSNFWLSQSIPVRSLFTDNIVAQVQADGALRLVVIDGFGTTVLFPWYTWGKHLGKIRARQMILQLRSEIHAYMENKRLQTPTEA